MCLFVTFNYRPAEPHLNQDANRKQIYKTVSPTAHSIPKKNAQERQIQKGWICEREVRVAHPKEGGS